MLRRQDHLIRALLGVAFFTVILGWNSVYCDNYPWNTPKTLCRGDRLYFPPTQKCYLPYRKGPCGELMVLEASANNPSVGECKCEKLCGPSNPQAPLVFVKEASRCYELFNQGPCQSGKWLVVRNGNSYECEQIPCPDKYNAQQPPHLREQSGTFVFADEGKCYTTKERGQWKCNADEVAYIDEKIFSPRCVPDYAGGCGNSGGGYDNDCENGSTPDLFGGCEVIASIQ